MTIQRPEFAAPVLIIDDFLPAEEADRCFEEALELKRVYQPARVGFGADNRLDPNIRSNDVIHLSDVFRSAPVRSDILTLLQKRVRSAECNGLWHKGYQLFDVINYATAQELTLSRYAADQHYGKHQDTVFTPDNKQLMRRLITICYYMQREPKRFAGGDLVLEESGSTLAVRTLHNRAVIFPSFVFHQVEGVKMQDTQFDSARFSVNYWLGFNA